MSKKLLSAILSIAMIVSMFATMFVASTGAAAETTYTADRDALRKAIADFYVQGPTLNTTTVDYLKSLGIFNWHGDGYWVQVKARNDFWGTAEADNYSYFITDTDFLTTAYGSNTTIVPGKVEWDISATATIKDNISKIVEYVASVWYFGQDENNEFVDPSFNSSRNAVLKNAANILNTLIGKLKGQVKSDSKPASYQTVFAGSDYKNFLAATPAYNASFGINPYFYLTTIDGVAQNAYVLPYYTVKWFTFDEIKATSEDAKVKLVEFQHMLMTVSVDNGAGVLYYDFVTTKLNPFKDAFYKLCESLITKVSSGIETLSFVDAIKGFYKLTKVLDVYTTYIADMYPNIYTATNVNLLTKALYAERILEFLGANPSLFMLAVVDLSTLADELATAIAASKPRAEQMLTATEITDGTALVKKANALLTSWNGWAGQDNANGVAWRNLNAATNTLKNMIPSKAGESVIVITEAGAFGSIKDLNGTEIKNDRIVVTFTPNYFSYVAYKAALESKISAFLTVLNTASISDGTSLSANEALLRDTLNKYGYLVGLVGGTVAGNGASDNKYRGTTNLASSAIYAGFLFEEAAMDITGLTDSYDFLAALPMSIGASTDAAVTCIYEAVLGRVYGSVLAGDNFDAAIDNIKLFVAKIIDAIEYFATNGTGTAFTSTALTPVPAATWAANQYKDVANTSNWAWTSGTYSVTSGFEKIAADIVNSLKYMTVDLTVYVNTAAYKLRDIMTYFGMVADGATKVYAQDAAYTGPLTAANFPNDYMKNFLAAANNLQRQLQEGYVNGDAGYILPTSTSIIAAYDNFVAATKAMFTDLGETKVDEFLRAVDNAVKAFYGDPTLDYDKLQDKLALANEKLEHYVSLTVAQPYLYIGYTLKFVASDATSSNLYAFDSNRLKVNLYDKIAAYLGANIDVSGWARDWSAEYQAVIKIGRAVLNSIDLATPAVNSDMPLWYALRVLADLGTVWAKNVDNTVAVIAAYKTELAALITEADGKNIYQYNVEGNEEASAIWTAFYNAYTNAIKAYYDGRIPKSEIDTAVATLKSTMADLSKIELAEGAATKETFEAKIADAEALVARANVTEYDSVKTLKEVIAAAKKVLQFNISVLTSADIQKEIDKLSTAMAAVEGDMYLGPKLKKDVRVLEMQVVKDLYTYVTYTKFQKGCDDAYATADTAGLKESEYVAAYNKVVTLFNGLKLAPVEEDTEEPVVEEPKESAIRKQAVDTYNAAAAEYSSLKDYSVESMAAYKATLDALKDAIEAEADDDTLIELIVAVKLAKASLTIPNPITCDD